MAMCCQAVLSVVLALALALSNRSARAEGVSQTGQYPENSRPVKVKIVLHRIGFSVSGGLIRSEAMPILDHAADLLRGSHDDIVILVDQSSRLTTESLDRAIARRRAKSVRTYLIWHGVAANRLTIAPAAVVASDARATQPHEKPPDSPVELHVD
jgi:outer membrane protein OmpA-like peptidoglycan-associated protein